MGQGSQGRAPGRRVLRRQLAGIFVTPCLVLAGCSGFSPTDLLTNPPAPGGPPQAGTSLGAGRVRVALLLPLSAGGNAGVAAISMRNAAEMALAEFNSQDLQLLIKDDGGNAPGAQLAAQQGLDEG